MLHGIFRAHLPPYCIHARAAIEQHLALGQICSQIPVKLKSTDVHYRCTLAIQVCRSLHCLLLLSRNALTILTSTLKDVMYSHLNGGIMTGIATKTYASMDLLLVMKASCIWKDGFVS